jgi:peptide/nickel transport system substrate-binding protein
VNVFGSFDDWTSDEISTAATLVVRPNQKAELGGVQPYADARVRRALALAVDNQVLLDLGQNGQGIVAENHHVAPVQPEYSPMPPIARDVEAARALMEEAGMMDFVHEMTSLDSGITRDTADACAAQLRDAGFQVERIIIPSSTFWNDWDTTRSRSRSGGIVRWPCRPSRSPIVSDAVWNETGVENAELDAVIAEALTIADPDARREVMFRAQQIMQEEGITIQPFWRSLYNARKANLMGARPRSTR